MTRKWKHESSSQGVERRLSVGVLNQHLVCALCSGYLVDATAISECLHRFCRSCIVTHLKQNRFCPICDVQLPEGRQWDCLRPDDIIQNLVYKLVPGLYKREMCARRNFYNGKRIERPEGEDGGRNANRFFSQEDGISVILEYYKLNESAGEPIRNVYLKCPAAVTVKHLKKFLRIKFELTESKLIDIIHEDECLPESFSLMDVAYTFNWNRLEQLKLSFRFYVPCIKPIARGLRKMEPKGDVTSAKAPPTDHKQKQNEYLGQFNLNPRGQINRNGLADPKPDDSDDSTNSELLIVSDKDSEDEYHPNKVAKKRKKHENKTYHMKRRKSDSFADGLMKEKLKSRRKSLYDVQIVQPVADQAGTLKNEALKKVFIAKDKPEPVLKKKKRKKSKHHESDMKKRKTEIVATPSIMSIGKDTLKLKVKLTPLKLTKEAPQSNGDDSGKIDKERLLHLRSVRHKSVNKEIISSSPSLTISKVDYSEQASKPSLVESKPSLEIMLVNKKDEAKKMEKALDLSEKANVLDLSEKSKRPKEVEKSGSKSTQQSILQMAETLVNRKLTPKPKDKPAEQSVAVVAMRDLKTLSDAAVNILMAAKTDTPKPDNTELKIPVFPRERPVMPPVPNLHEIYPKRRPPMIQNQTVRHIPDPSSVILNRNFIQHNRPDSSTSPNKTIPPLIKAKLPIPTKPANSITSSAIKMPNPVVGMRRMDMTKNIETVAAGLTARANALIDAK